MKTMEELLEEDMIRFLDEHIGTDLDQRRVIRAEEENMFDLERDYEKEVKDALGKNDLAKAKKVFDELRLNYAKLKYSDIDKPKLFRILDNIHLQIKNYLITQKEEKNIYKEIKSLQPEDDEAMDILRKKYAEVEHLIKTNQMEKAKEVAKLLIGSYNQLPPMDRTPERYSKIKNLLLTIK